MLLFGLIGLNCLRGGGCYVNVAERNAELQLVLNFYV